HRLTESRQRKSAEVDTWLPNGAPQFDEIRRAVQGLQEVNPMLGLRGCRLGIVHPEITQMQARAIFEAACAIAAPRGLVLPEIMIPLTATVVEFRKQALVVRRVAED